jgi:fused signal recognition particle receptor
VLADTAGRRANSTNLLDELAKVRRVADREPGQVLETLLVLDATTGQNALSQAREFLAAANATGIVLTKFDGTARGGIVIAIERDLGIPVKFIGIGEGVDDLIVFDPEEFVDSLLGVAR